MSSTRYPLIAREGWGAIGVVAAGAAAVAHFIDPYWSLPLWLAVVVLVFIFRDPDREIPPSPLAVVSPVDGCVMAVEETYDPYLDRRAVRISIRMRAYGVFSTRSPVEGKVMEPRGAKGEEHLLAGMPHGVWLQTDEDDNLVVAMNRGPIGNAPRCYVGFGERVGQGQRCGFVHLGSLVDVYVPSHTRIDVQPGMHVRGGADVIASLVHK